MSKIIKMKDLRPGDVILSGRYHYEGVVYEIDIEGKSFFWEHRPNITLFDLNDSYFGPGCCEIKDLNKKVEIETDRKKIVKAHKIIDSDLAKQIADTMQYRNTFGKIHWKTLEEINKK